MGTKRKTYSVEEKLRAVEMHLNERVGFKTIAKELNISTSMVRRWVQHYQIEGLEGLQERRGKAVGINKGRPRKKPLSQEEELIRLRAENEYLKKLWALRKGERD